jgi:hypothetical protein
MAVAQRLPVARDDEQRVVDPDADSDHRHRLCREVRHRQPVGGDLHQRDAGPDSKQRGEDGQTGGEDRAERDE